MLLSGADIIIRTLIEQGTDGVFGYPGGQIIHVYDSLYKYAAEIRHVLVSHEQGAAHAADGYARATGRVGVCISTSGPGATNLVTGIATAYLDSVPLVAICGNVTTGEIGTDSFQEVDITGITLPITKYNYFVGDVTQLADTIRDAFRIAMSGRPGPVLVDVPKDVQTALCEYDAMPQVECDPRKPAKDIRITEAAECINSAKRPFIYFGGGVLSSGAKAEMLELAEKIDAPLGASMMGLNALESDHPRFLGMQGMHGHYASSMAMHNSDCIIALGVRFNDRVIGKRSKFAQRADIVHIDIDGAELSKVVYATHGLRADVKLSLERLLPLIEKVERPEWWETIAGYKAEEERNLDTREGLTPRNAIRTLNAHLAPTTPVVTDVGQHQMWTAQNLHLQSERRFISSGGLGTMGFGMGASVGAAIATGEATVLVTGDSSFGMTACELATAVSERLPIIVLIMNNRVLGMVRQWQTIFFGGRYSGTMLDGRQTDFVALARAYGADGERVDTLESLDAALSRGFAMGTPYVIDCAIDRDEMVLPMLPQGGSIDDIIVKNEEL